MNYNYSDHKEWTISISNQSKATGTIDKVETENILGLFKTILQDNDYDDQYEITTLPNLIQYYGQTKDGSNLIVIAKWYLAGYTSKEEMENDNMKNEYTVISSDYGSQPIAGYLSDIIKMVADMGVDGWHLIGFIDALSDRTEMAEKKNEADEFFFVIDDNINRCKGTLTYNICETYNQIFTKDKCGYAEEVNIVHDWSEDARAFRLYVDDEEDWGLDEIKLEKNSPWRNTADGDEYYVSSKTGNVYMYRRFLEGGARKPTNLYAVMLEYSDELYIENIGSEPKPCMSAKLIGMIHRQPTFHYDMENMIKDYEKDM